MSHPILVYMSIEEINEVIEDLDWQYRAAYSAICHCEKNPSGVFGENCPCEHRKDVAEALQLILEIKNQLVTKYENKKGRW